MITPASSRVTPHCRPRSRTGRAFRPTRMPSIVAVPAARLAPVRGPKLAARPRRVVLLSLPAARRPLPPTRVAARSQWRAGKRKGFAELMGGGDEDTVTVKKNAPAAESSEPVRRGRRPPLPRCCKPFHKGTRIPGLRHSHALAILRRAKGEGSKSSPPRTPRTPAKDGAKAESGKVVSTLADDVKMTCKKVRFYDLEIVTDKASKDGEHLVGFRYKCRVRGQKGFNELAEEKHSELSTFRRGEDGKWLFLDGITGEVE